MGCDLDQDRINDKITFILNTLHKLKFLKGLSKEEFNTDFRNVDSAKYALQVSIEAMIDIANHIIARKRLGRPKTYGESFTFLLENSIISKEKCEVFRTMVKFRNRGVHLYHEVDPTEIYKILHSNLQDFVYFVEEIRKYLAFRN